MTDKYKRGQYTEDGGSPPPQTVRRSLAEVAIALEKRKKKRQNLTLPPTRGDRAKTLEEMLAETSARGWKRNHMAAADLAPQFRGHSEVPVGNDEDN
jgi:hypothetical protein